MLSVLAAGFGAVTGGALLFFGIYATAKSRGGAFRALPAALRQILSPPQSGREVSPFRAFATSLAGTIGVGNITGVALAIALGGPGAVFWMWVSALLCMTVKYFEIFLALRHQPEGEQTYGFAPMEYIRKATESKGFAGIFALFGLFSALTMGNMIQTNAAATAAKTALALPLPVTGILFTAGTALFLFGGIRRIAGALEKAVPLLGGLFLVVGLAVIGLHYDRILPAFSAIFREAFSFSSAGGGFLGSGIALAFRYGMGNGLFSHEAGLGSAGLVHGVCGADPKKQGLWGIFEVLFDTAVISTVSALMILTAGKEGASDGVLSAARHTLGTAGGWIVALCLILFAFLSVLSWGCYGETCFVWLCGKEAKNAFRLLYLTAPLFAVFAPEPLLWSTAELINGGMLILNLTGLMGFREDLKLLRE